MTSGNENYRRALDTLRRSTDVDALDVINRQQRVIDLQEIDINEKTKLIAVLQDLREQQRQLIDQYVHAVEVLQDIKRLASRKDQPPEGGSCRVKRTAVRERTNGRRVTRRDRRTN